MDVQSFRWASSQAGQREKASTDSISETMKCKMLILGKDIGKGFRCATSWCDLDLTLPL